MDNASETLNEPLINDYLTNVTNEENVPTENSHISESEIPHILNPIITDTTPQVIEPVIPAQQVIEPVIPVPQVFEPVILDVAPQVFEPVTTPIISEAPNEQMDTFLLALIPDSSAKLSPDEIAFMTNLLKDASGVILPQIRQTVQNILNDGAISLHDIPQLVLLITQIFQSNVSLKNVNSINLIQYTLDSLIQSNILPIPASLQSVAINIVDTSITLLRTSLPQVEEECTSIFSCCFRGQK